MIALSSSSAVRLKGRPVGSGNKAGLEAMREDDPDSELVQAAQAGDTSAYEELVGKYEKKVFSLAYRILGQRSTAEDVVQETFLQAYLDLPYFRGKSSFRTWLFQIAYHRALDSYRARKREATISLDALQAGGWQKGEEDYAEKEETRLLLETLLSRLTPRERALVTMKYLNGFSYVEISRIVGDKPGSLKVSLHRIMKKLRDIWKEGL